MTEMTPLQIMSQEWHNIGTTWTRNEDFDRDGYLGIESLWDPKELYHPVPKERGKMRWWGNKIDQFQYDEIEGQVEGSISRYNHCLLYTSPSPRDLSTSRMPSSA